MARVHYRKARKDYPFNGIVKGDMYYTASIKTGPRTSKVLRQLAPITRAQMTSSPYLSIVYDLEDNLYPSINDSAAMSTEDVSTAREAIQEAGEQAQEAFENLPESLQASETGQRLEARVSACDEAITYADELEQEIIERDSAKNDLVPEPDDDGEDDYEDKLDEYERLLGYYEDCCSSVEQAFDQLTSMDLDPGA